jgi:integrase
MPETKPIKDEVVRAWLQEFNSHHTRTNYLSSLRRYKKALNIDSLDDYVKNTKDATDDLKKFVMHLNGAPSMTIKTRVCAVKSFLNDQNITVEEDSWKKMRRRGFYPKRVKASTRDKKPTKEQLKQIIEYCSDIKAKALFLFLASSGARIGETLKIEIEDFDLEADPPRAFISGDITKGGVGERTVYFSYEARDALKNWLAIKDNTRKSNGESFRSPLMFPISIQTAITMFYNATSKAGLSQKDRRTNRHLIHIHSIRKFFRSNVGLDTDITHALMGHSGYLDEAYVRLNEAEVGEAYKKNMAKVSVYAVEDLELRKTAEEQKKEIEDLKMKVKALEETKKISVGQAEAEIGSLNEFIVKRLSPLVSWAENQGYKIEDFSTIRDETPERWKKPRKESSRGEGLKCARIKT